MKKQLFALCIAFILCCICGVLCYAQTPEVSLAAAKAILNKTPIGSYITGVKDTTSPVYLKSELYFKPCRLEMDENRHRIIVCDPVEGDWFMTYVYVSVEFIKNKKTTKAYIKVPALIWNKDLKPGAEIRLRKFKVDGKKKGDNSIAIFFQQ